MNTILNLESGGGDIEVDRFVNKVLINMKNKGFSESQRIKIIDFLSMLPSGLSVNKEDEDIEAKSFAGEIILDMEDDDFTEKQKIMVADLLCENVLGT